MLKLLSTFFAVTVTGVFSFYVLYLLVGFANDHFAIGAPILFVGVYLILKLWHVVEYIISDFWRKP